jgi:hypothetical protein
VTAPGQELPRPLPIRPRPATGESVGSYIRRLAQANHLRPGYLRRYLNSQPSQDSTLRLDWLAALAGRTLPDLERALADPIRRHADKPALFTAIRDDAHDAGHSIRALADRHGVHRRTVRQALTSPTPPARKKQPPRRSRLDPFKNAIDAMLRAEQNDPAQRIQTIQSIFDRLVVDHGMTDVSYSTVQHYVTRRRDEPPPHRVMARRG